METREVESLFKRRFVMSRWTTVYLIAASISATALMVGPTALAATTNSNYGSSMYGQNLPKIQELEGTITSINPQSKTMTVKGAMLSKSFKLARNTEIANEDNTAARFSNLKVGDHVRVSYRDQNDALVATYIVRTQRNARSSGSTATSRSPSSSSP